MNYRIVGTPQPAMVELSIHFRKKLSTGFFGGEGLFNTLITGTGTIVLQTMPSHALAASIFKYFPASK